MPITKHTVARVHNAIAPENAPVYFALFSDYEASVELEVGGYARVEYFNGWLDGKGTRVNAGPVVWGAMAEDVAVRSVGFFDAGSGGVLLGWSRVLTLTGAEMVLAVAKGDECSMPAGAVRVVVLE